MQVIFYMRMSVSPGEKIVDVPAATDVVWSRWLENTHEWVSRWHSWFSPSLPKFTKRSHFVLFIFFQVGKLHFRIIDGKIKKEAGLPVISVGEIGGIYVTLRYHHQQSSWMW
jgi:hypothetical protein